MERCQSCHGPEKQLAGLRVDSLAALVKGGNRGPALQPGKPAASLLLTALRHEGELKMPPAVKLSDREIADFSHWIESGAAWGTPSPNTRTPEHLNTAKPHWAFQPVRRPTIPKVKNQAWVQTPIDAFILAELEKKGLKPAPPADPRTLIRRVTFDLTGLPPTPEEVEAFEKALSLERYALRGQESRPGTRTLGSGPSSQGSTLNAQRSSAYARLVDRLLASPAYGERWGRHWLDVARYADSNGMDENVHYGNAWRYRDYVVQAFNSDKPYDRFIREQLAGDLLPDPGNPAARRERLIATGFISIGPKVISEVDDRKMEMDMVDEQLDTTGRTFMAMTLGCARCHDHKFDPISTEDYYALAGIFKSTKTMTVMKKPRMWFEHSLAEAGDQERLKAHEQEVARRKAAITSFVARETERVRASLAAGAPLPKNVETVFPEPARAELKRMRDEVAALEKSPPEMPAAMGVTEGTVGDLPIHVRGNFLTLGKVVPRRFPIVMAGAQQPPMDEKASGRLRLAEWLASPDHPLTGRVLVNRVWRWHFGKGIVPSTDNFGLLGERPTNPALLDYLASVFVATPGTGGGAEWANGRKGEREKVGTSSAPTLPLPHPPTPPGRRSLDPYPCGWSLKTLHRLILLSSTYQMSAAYDPKASAVDPENRLRWRWDVRRLEAEAIRDSLLAVSGLLDRSMGGRALALKNREYVFDHTSKDGTKYDSRRRSLYLPVVRNHLYDVFQLFDFGDGSVPEGNRTTTTVAPQALFMMNSDVVMDAAEALAGRLLSRSDLDTGARVDLLYRTAYGRSPEAKESARAAALLAQFEGSQEPSVPAPERARHAWTWLSHTVLAANEFIYVQ